jgi:hypothetical protein
LVENTANEHSNTPRNNRRAQDTLDTISAMRLGLNKKKDQDDRKGLIGHTNDWDSSNHNHLI